jgi:hypothetical protein
MKVFGELIEVEKLSEVSIKTMFMIMDAYYDQMTYLNFLNDLREKDFCILIKDEIGRIQGFSTQKLISFPLNDKVIHGVFSGDTIIDKNYWGSFELYKVFGKSFTKYCNLFPEFYWFLISKGYKTYKMLPLFFKIFYPNYSNPIPEYEKQVLDAFGHFKYPNIYNARIGVIEYPQGKDKLKDGVADITSKQLKDKNIQFFLKSNPNYILGHDLVCLARLDTDNLKPTAKRLFVGEN